MKRNALNWFEIFVADFDRSRNFYENILGVTLQVVEGCSKMAVFPYAEETGVGGCLSLDEKSKAGEGGTMIYLNVEGDLDGVLSRVEASGGSVLQSRTEIPPHGYLGIFKDPEGNVVGLHSMS